MMKNLVIVFGLATLALFSCGRDTLPNSGALHQAQLQATPNEGIDLKIDLDQKVTAQPNPDLAKIIKNQLSSTLGFLPNFPIRLKKSVDSDVGVVITNIEMIPSRNVSKDTKNDLVIKTGIGSGSVNVAYSMIQRSYDLTLTVEDNHNFLYTYHTILTVNEHTSLSIKGAVNIDVLKILPASIQKILAVFFEEVFTANGSSENTLNWDEKIAPSMLPIMEGEITEFQVQMIKEVISPLCASLNANYAFDKALDCRIPQLKMTSVDTALALKLAQRNMTSNPIGNPASTGVAGPAKRRIDSRLFEVSSCDLTGKPVGFLGIFKQMLVYARVPASVLAKNYYFYRLYSDKWSSPTDLLALTPIETVDPATCKLAKDSTMSCVSFEWQVAIGVQENYKNLCSEITENNAIFALSDKANLVIAYP